MFLVSVQNYTDTFRQKKKSGKDCFEECQNISRADF